MLFACLSLFCGARQRYGVVVDAGSSSTKCTVLTWNETKSGVPELAQIGDRIVVNIKLASAATDPTVVPTIFNEIIRKIAGRIPANEISRTRLLVGATAGIRVLPVDDQKKVMTDVYYFLRIHSPYRVKRDYVRVLEGYEEGIYGWLSMSLLTGRFAAKTTNTTAFSDMGGSSMELVYETGDRKRHVHDVTVGSEVFHLFSYCYDGYGADAVVDYIIPKVNGSEHPCFLRGHNFTFRGQSYYGTGDVEGCVRLINETLINVPEMMGVDYPSKSEITDVVGASFFSVIVAFMNLTTNSTVEDLRGRMLEWSSLTWDQVDGKYPNYPKCGNYMMLGWYCYHVLVDGYKFNDDNAKFWFLYTVKGRQVDWTLGALLTHIYDVRIDDVNRIPWKPVFWANLGLLLVTIPLFVVYLHPWRKDHPPTALICP